MPRMLLMGSGWALLYKHGYLECESSRRQTGPSEKAETDYFPPSRFPFHISTADI